MKRRVFVLVACLTAALAISCSGADSTPTTPDTNSGPGLSAGQGLDGRSSGAGLWGLWEVSIDPETQVVEAVPLRGAAFTMNVVKFVDGPPPNLLVSVRSVDVKPAYRDIGIDVGIRHPFAGAKKLTGFDVAGVFMGRATDTYPGPGGFPVAGADDQQLLNADGYTRWFNATEFGAAPKHLFAYTPGAFGSKGFTPSAELNPYKYFADGLGKAGDAFMNLANNPGGRGSFGAGSTNYREYDIRFPFSAPFVFQYAIVAHWKGAGVPDPELQDFPPDANADEALVFRIDDFSTAFYNMGESGGEVILYISPLDWSEDCTPSVEEYAIRCYSTAWSGAYAVDMTPILTGGNYCTFRAEIPVETLTSNLPLPVWIEVGYPQLDYTNPFGVPNDAHGQLAGYYRHEVPIKTCNSGFALTWGDGGNDEAADVAVDSGGNTYVTGSFRGSVDFDPSGRTVERTSNGGSDVFLSKFSACGDLQWAKTWGGEDDEEGTGVVADSSGGVYVTGFFEGTVDFDPGAGIDEHTAIGVHDAFLVKFKPSGEAQWAGTWGGIVRTSGRAIDVDGSGGVYVIGWFEHTVDFDPGPGNDYQDTNGATDMFLSKFDSSGVYQWANTWGGGGDDYIFGVAAQSSGNVYVTGQFHGGVDFDPGPGEDMHSSSGPWGSDIFLSRFLSTGAFHWAQTWGSTGHESGSGVATDASGNVYVTGPFEGVVDFDPGPLGDFRPSNGALDAFLSKFDPSGTYQWALTWGGSGQDSGEAVTLHGSANVLVTGNFQDVVDFDPDGEGDEHSSNGSDDVFLSKLNSSGGFQWARTWGGDGSDRSGGVGVGSLGYAHVAGTFQSEVMNFAPSGPPCNEDPDEHISNGGRDAFLSRYMPNGCW